MSESMSLGALKLLMWGLGMLVGTQIAGWVGEHYTEVVGDVVLHQWQPIWLWPAALSAVVFLLFLVGGRDVKQAASETGDKR